MSVAVLGLGSIGLRHARNLLALGEAVSGFDPDPARREALARAGGRAAACAEAALEGARAAAVCSPSGLHREHLALVVGAGCHVFMEKPLAHTDQGLEALLAQAESARLVVFNALMLRLHPAALAARRLLADGGLGRPLWARLLCASYLPGWRPGQDHRRGYAADPLSGGALLDHIHEVDLANFLLGPARVKAAVALQTGTLGLASEEGVDLVLAHECGAHSSLHVDYLTRPPRRVTEVAGERGGLEIDLNGRRLRCWDADGRSLQDEAFPGSFAEDYLEEMRCFLACTRGEAEPPCGAREALAVLRQVLDARRMAGMATG